MITGVANKKISTTDTDPVRIIQLSRTWTNAAETRNVYKLTFARIEKFELGSNQVKEISAPIWTKGNVTRCCQTT
jgi:hypothetical protein